MCHDRLRCGYKFGAVDAVGLDETLFAREGPFRRQRWSPQIVEVGRALLLDIVAGHDADGSCRSFAEWPQPSGTACQRTRSHGRAADVAVVEGGWRRVHETEAQEILGRRHRSGDQRFPFEM